MRILSLLLLCVAAIAYAAEINGTITLKDVPKGKMNVGYEAVTTAGEKIGNMAGVTIMDTRAEVTCTTYKPRNTTLKSDPKAGITFQHTTLPAGEYLVYAKYNDRYLDWKIVKVPNATAVITVAFTIEKAQVGHLVFDVTQGMGDYQIILLPMPGPKQALPAKIVADRAFNLRIDVDIERGNRAKIEGVKAGFYQLTLQRAEHHGTEKSGRWTSYTDIGAWTVEVKAGRTMSYQAP